MSGIHTIALLSQPNAGKSTLFNGLTGSRQHVGNWPGKTVEKKEGTFKAGGNTYTVVDLPGSYSLSANSDEEIVTRDYIASGKADLICILVDASQLERSMFMLADYIGIKVPTVLLLNMMDVAGQQGQQIDYKALEKELHIPVLPFVAADTKEIRAMYPISSIKPKTRLTPKMKQTIIRAKYTAPSTPSHTREISTLGSPTAAIPPDMGPARRITKADRTIKGFAITMDSTRPSIITRSASGFPQIFEVASLSKPWTLSLAFADMVFPFSTESTHANLQFPVKILPSLICARICVSF